MAIIYTYPLTELLATDDTIVITDSSSPNKATRSATIGQINALGPQGTVTDVNITGSQGFIITKDPDPFTSGVLNFAITLGEGLGLPADDPVDSVQFNKNGILTGIPEFTFKEATYSGGNLEVNLNVGGVNNRRGLVNVKGSGTAGQPGGVAFFNDNPSLGNVSIYGPTGNNTSGGYGFRLPLENPSASSTHATPPLLLAIDSEQTPTSLYTTSWVNARDLGISAAGESFELQYRKFGEPGVFDASPQLGIQTIGGSAQPENGVIFFVGSMSRIVSTLPQRGDVRIGSGPTGQGDSLYGGTVRLEYVSNGAGPRTVAGAAAYSHVTLAAPTYDPNIEVVGTDNFSIKYQDYDLVLPQLNPEYSDNNVPYKDENDNNVSKILIVNSLDSSNVSGRTYESKFISLSNLGIGPGGATNNVQYKGVDGKFNGSSAFQYNDNNGGAGAPNSKPAAHEIILGAGGGGLPGMLTIFGDNDDVENGGTDGILRFVAPTGTDYATISGPDIQTEITLSTGGSGYEALDSSTTLPTTVLSSPSNKNGSGLRVFVELDVETGAIESVSVANQGSGYGIGDVLEIEDPQGQGQGATITVIAVRDVNNPDDEAQIYDIKLPKYAPGDDKIWFGKGTGKNTELTNSEYFKIPLIQEAGHSPGGRLQLTIGSPNLTPQEPWGSILINGGNNTNESGVIRLASVYNSVVGIMGPKAIDPGTEDYDYDFMLPYLPPEEEQRPFINGVKDGTLSGGSGITQNGTLPRVSTTVIDPNNPPSAKPQPAGKDCFVEVTIENPNPGQPNGTVTDFKIVDPGDGYAVGDVLKINTSGTPEGTKATITVDEVEGNRGKVLVSNKSATTTTAFPYETRWIDFPDGGGSDLAIENGGNQVADAATTIDFTGAGVTASGDNTKVTVNVPPRLNHGFSPFPIYQGSAAVVVGPNETRAYAGLTICDIAAGQITVARLFGSISDNTVISVAVYTGSNSTAATLVAFGQILTNNAQSDAILKVNIELSNLWSPVAGTPIWTVVEIDNTLEDNQDVALLGTTSAYEESAGNMSAPSWMIDPTQDIVGGSPTSVFNTEAGGNTKYGDRIDTLLAFGVREESPVRICQHYDPFAQQAEE